MVGVGSGVVSGGGVGAADGAVEGATVGATVGTMVGRGAASGVEGPALAARAWSPAAVSARASGWAAAGSTAA